MAAAGVSDDFKDQFRCASCKKYLRPPVITCVKGHNVCKLCHSPQKKCPKGKCAYTKPLVQNATIEAMLKTLKLPVSCKHVGCDVEVLADDVHGHEGECPHRKISCPVLDCRRKIKLVALEEHLLSSHQSMMNDKWQLMNFGTGTGGATTADDTSHQQKREAAIKPMNLSSFAAFMEAHDAQRKKRAAGDAGPSGATAATGAVSSPSHPLEPQINKCAMKSWMQFGDIRMFAVAIHAKNDLWYIVPVASVSEDQAKKFRCETRLASKKLPFSTTFCGPVLSIESRTMNGGTEKFSSEPGCFVVHSSEVSKHVDGNKEMEIPFTFKISKAESPSDETLCIMCQDRRPEVVLAPCGHQNVCGPCAHEWNGRPPRDGGGSCPMCRQPIAMIVSPIPF